MIQVLIHLPSIVAFILAAILLIVKRKRPSSRYLAYAFISMGTCFLTMISYAYPYLKGAWLWDVVTDFATFLAPSFLFLCSCSAMQVEGVREKEWKIMYIPVGVAAANLLCYLLMAVQGYSTSDYLAHVLEYKGVLPTAPLPFRLKRFFGSDLYRMGALAMTFYVLIHAYQNSKNYLATIEEYFSSMTELAQKNHKTLMFCFGSIAIGMLIFMTRSFSLERSFLIWGGIGAAVMVFAMVSVFYFSIKGNRTMPILQKTMSEGVALERSERLAEQQSINGRIRMKIDRLIEDKFFLDPNVNLVELTAKIGSNRTYVSSFINTEYRCSFSDFVNGMRADHAKKLMDELQEEPDYNAIMHQSGFGSIQSFTRNFSKFTGYTPSEYYNHRKTK